MSYYRPLTDWQFIRRFLRTHADIDNTNMRERNRGAHGQAHDDASSAEQEDEIMGIDTDAACGCFGSHGGLCARHQPNLFRRARHRQTPMQKVREPSPDLVRASSLRNERQHDTSPSACAARRAGRRAMLKLSTILRREHPEFSPGARA